ncbi:MAG: hypothetical protein JW881_14060 [Spirochaetales bacterium]|nr:hypothetical protein [Spirochaetales bacterium]
MRKNTLLNLAFLSLVFFLLLIFMTLTAMEDSVGSDKELLQPAYWNQEEYDRALHAIDQPRDLTLQLTVTNGGKPSAGLPFEIVTGDEVSSGEILDAAGYFRKKVRYHHSFIETVFDNRIIPSSSRIDSTTYSWYYPGEWFSSLIYTVDFSLFSVKERMSAGKEEMEYAFSYPAGWKEKNAGVSFGSLYGMSSDAAAEPGGRKDTEARIIREEKGVCRVILHMNDFFRKWNDNYSTPYKAGDAYRVTIGLTLMPPGDFFTTAPSDRLDPAFVPKRYGGEVEATDGDPFLSVPSIVPEEKIRIEITRDIRLTAEMLAGYQKQGKGE